MTYSIYTCLTFAALLLLGGSISAKWIRYYSSESGLLDIFFSNVVTMLAITSIYACIKTGMHTVLLLSIPLILFYIKTQTVRIFGSKQFYADLLPGILMVILCTVACFVYILPKSIESDVTYYAKLASYLHIKGVENNFHYYNDLLTSKIGLIPYHYFELWLTALVQYVTGFTTLIDLKFVIYPYLMAVCLIGILGTYEHIAQRKVSMSSAITLFFLTLLLALFGQYLSIKCSGWDILSSMWLRPNFVLNYLVLVPVVIGVYDKNLHLLAAGSMLACLLSVTLIPALLPSVFVYLGYTWYFEKESLWKVAKPGIFIVCFVVLYFLFYAFNGGDLNFIESRSITGIILNSFKIWKATLGTFLNMVVRCLIFVPLFYLLFKKGFFTRGLLFFFASMSIISVGLFQLLNQLDNSYQIPHLAFCLLAFLLLIASLYVLNKVSIMLQMTVALLVGVAGIYANKKQFIPSDYFVDNRPFFVSQRGLDATFAKELAHTLETTEGYAGFYLDQARLDRTELRYRTEYTLQPVHEIAYYTDKNNMICVNAKEQIMNGEGKGREILEVWYKEFSGFCSEKDPFSYLADHKLSTLLISNAALDPAMAQPYKKLSDANWSLFINTQTKP